MKARNTAQQLYQYLGKDIALFNFGGKNFANTKKGPGRKHKQGKV